MAKIRLPEELKNFGNIFDSISHKHGHYHVFEDFLDMSINAWCYNHQIDLPRLQKKYTLEERHQFGELIKETIRVLDRMIVDDTSFYDLFGTFYEIHSLTNKHFAQFFTPLPVCLLMAQIVSPKNKEHFADPCCGSARFSLAANSVNLGMFHSLIDIDYTCARMSALNLLYHGIHGIVICDNGLLAGKSFKGAFIVNRWLPYTKTPQIEFEPNVNRAYGYVRNKLGMPEHQPEQKGKPTTTANQEIADLIVDSKTNQISMF
ncbi:MAG: N-6 DNA methylase [Bacteroidota bacterium]